LPDGVPFRIDVGAFSAEFLTDFIADGTVRAMDASGAVIGTGLAPAPKGKKFVSFNYRYGSQLEVLPDDGTPVATGRIGEVLLSTYTGFCVYRDWQDGLGSRAIDVNELVTGEDADLFAATDKDAWGMTSEGGIFGKLGAGDYYEIFMLFEVPAVDPNP
jgi:hypothetical protein